MINLMPASDQKELTAARTNSLLLQYLILVGIVILVMLAEMVTVYLILSTSKAANQSTIAENNKRTSGYQATENQAKDFKNNLAIAKQILDSQISYTSVLTSIASLTPANVVIDNLSINPSTFGKPTMITAHAKTSGDALNLKSRLSSSKLLSNVNFQSLTNQPSDPSGYPYTVILNVTFNKAGVPTQ